MSASEAVETRTQAQAERYEVRTGDARTDADAAVRVWHEGGFATAGDARTRYDWFYTKNPAGEGQLNFLHTSGTAAPVGFLGVGPRQYSVQGEAVAAGMLVDFVVRPEHRTAVPALALQRAGRQRASETMQFVYGLPDTKAVMIFKRLGADVKLELPTFARVVRSKSYLARHMPQPIAAIAGVLVDGADRLLSALRLAGCGFQAEWLDAFDERFDRLWNAYDKRDTSIGVRDRAFLSWRFASQPGKQYRILAVSRRGSGELAMYFVCETHDGILNIKDCLCAVGEEELARGLLMLVRAARELPVSVIHLQIASRRNFPGALRAVLFRHRSQRPFFAMLSDSLRQTAANADWYVTQADEDI